MHIIVVITQVQLARKGYQKVITKDIREMKSKASAAGLSFLAYCQMSGGVDLASPLT